MSVPYEAAMAAARYMSRFLRGEADGKPVVRRFVSCGSLRRALSGGDKAPVGDIEFLIESTSSTHLALHKLCEGEHATLVKGAAKVGWKMAKLELQHYHHTIPVELYVATPQNWGYILAIRTGPKDFSRDLVTPVSKGGLMPAGISVQGGMVYQGDIMRSQVAVPTEEAFFELWGLPCAPPHERGRHAAAA